MRKAIIEFDEGSQTQGTVINIIECSDNGLKGIRVPLGQTIWEVLCVPYVK